MCFEHDTFHEHGACLKYGGNRVHPGTGLWPASSHIANQQGGSALAHLASPTGQRSFDRTHPDTHPTHTSTRTPDTYAQLRQCPHALPAPLRYHRRVYSTRYIGLTHQPASHSVPDSHPRLPSDSDSRLTRSRSHGDSQVRRLPDRQTAAAAASLSLTRPAPPAAADSGERQAHPTVRPATQNTGKIMAAETSPKRHPNNNRRQISLRIRLCRIPTHSMTKTAVPCDKTAFRYNKAQVYIPPMDFSPRPAAWLCRLAPH